MSNDKRVQIYNPSNCDGLGKVVQLEFQSKFYLLFDQVPHCCILKSFLEEENVDFKLVQAHNSSVLIPSPDGDNYKVLGMGRGNFYFGKKLYTGVGASSVDYNMGIDEKQEGFLRETLLSKGWTCI